jgi:negative regulator of flagellin synthesis FlgM
MDVSGLGSVQGASPLRSATPANSASGKPAESSATTTPKDELELSAAGVAMDRVGETPEMRAERLAQIKEAIDDGSYETDEKLDAALSRMFDSFGIDLDDE